MNWLDLKEQGSAAGLWFMVVLSTLGGRLPARLFLRLLTPYYMALAGPARRASRDYLQQIHGRATWSMVHDHLLTFAQCTLDRLFLVQGKVDLFDVTSHGQEHLEQLLERRQGALLLGAHLGSFEALQRLADDRNIPINIIGYFRNARMINRTLRHLNPNSQARLLEFVPENIEFILRVRERIEQGEIVAILADRTRPGGRQTVVDFLGQRAPLPTGPYLLASVLKCPVYLTFGLYSAPNRYDLYCEPFAERIVLPRRGRRRALHEWAQRFATRLESYCRLDPDNWFNFYDFWEPRPNSRAPGLGLVAGTSHAS
jgi:predicted LPLAT superfamily acyltransferase